MSGVLQENACCDERALHALDEIVQRFGTPSYAFDVRRLRSQVAKIHSHLPDGVQILYSLKANASLGICDVLAQCEIGADAASAGELATAIAAGFPEDRIFVAGPFKLPETIAQLRERPSAVVSVDSTSELLALSRAELRNPLVLRLRPDFGSCAVVPAGSESRFGLTCETLGECRELLRNCELNVIGFHVFAGSQVLDAVRLNEHLRRSLDLSLRAAEILNITPTYFNLGGGFGIPYGPHDVELDLTQVGAEVALLADRAAPARLVFELGRYLVAESGWYLAAVVGHQTFQGRPAVIVDGGVHQRADMCGLCLRSSQNAPIVLGREDTDAVAPTAVLGCLSLPDDVLVDSVPLPPLSVGDVVAFPNAGAYGLWSSPAIFHGSPLPAEVAFDDDSVYLMRPRKAAQSILDDQRHVPIGKGVG